MPVPPSVNRRSYFRQPMESRVSLRVAGVRVPIVSTLLDLSGGGAQVEARSVLKVGASVEFDLPRPGEAALRLTAVIQKVSYAPDTRQFRYALGFTTLDETTHDALMRFITAEQRRAIVIKSGRMNDRVSVAKSANEQRTHRRVDVEISVRYGLVGSAMNREAISVDVSTGGMRILTDRVLRQEWKVNVLLALPPTGDEVSLFRELRLEARALPGLRQSRGQYIQSLIWVDPDPDDTAEIERFVRLKLRTKR